MGQIKQKMIAELPDDSEIQDLLAQQWQERDTLKVPSDIFKALWKVAYTSKGLAEEAELLPSGFRKELFLQALQDLDNAEEREQRGWEAWRAAIYNKVFPKEAS